MGHIYCVRYTTFPTHCLAKKNSLANLASDLLAKSTRRRSLLKAFYLNLSRKNLPPSPLIFDVSSSLWFQLNWTNVKLLDLPSRRLVGGGGRLVATLLNSPPYLANRSAEVVWQNHHSAPQNPFLTPPTPPPPPPNSFTHLQGRKLTNLSRYLYVHSFYTAMASAPGLQKSFTPAIHSLLN